MLLTWEPLPPPSGSSSGWSTPSHSATEHYHVYQPTPKGGVEKYVGGKSALMDGTELKTVINFNRAITGLHLSIILSFGNLDAFI